MNSHKKIAFALIFTFAGLLFADEEFAPIQKPEIQFEIIQEMPSNVLNTIMPVILKITSMPEATSIGEDVSWVGVIELSTHKYFSRIYPSSIFPSGVIELQSKFSGPNKFSPITKYLISKKLNVLAKIDHIQNNIQKLTVYLLASSEDDLKAMAAALLEQTYSDWQQAKTDYESAQSRFEKLPEELEKARTQFEDSKRLLAEYTSPDDPREPVRKMRTKLYELQIEKVGLQAKIDAIREQIPTIEQQVKENKGDSTDVLKMLNEQLVLTTIDFKQIDQKIRVTQQTMTGIILEIDQFQNKVAQASKDWVQYQDEYSILENQINKLKSNYQEAILASEFGPWVVKMYEVK